MTTIQSAKLLRRLYALIVMTERVVDTVCVICIGYVVINYWTESCLLFVWLYVSVSVERVAEMLHHLVLVPLNTDERVIVICVGSVKLLSRGVAHIGIYVFSNNQSYMEVCSQLGCCSLKEAMKMFCCEGWVK